MPHFTGPKGQRIECFVPDCLPSEPPPGWKLNLQNMDGARYIDMVGGLVVIVSGAVELDGKRWVHLSLSHRARLPHWKELVEAKELFLGREALAVQIIPPREQYVNINPRVLHLWQCLDGDPTPDFRHGGDSI